MNTRFLSATNMWQAEYDLLLQARLGPDWLSVLTRMGQTSLQMGVTYTGVSPKVIRHEGPTAYRIKRAQNHWPYAHLLSVSMIERVVASDRDGGEYIDIYAYCRGRSDSKQFIGVRAGGTVGTTHPGP